ncbi:MAG: hypothetical protein ABIE55_04985 [Candidatus Aenigmatarchaeota archaeon]
MKKKKDCIECGVPLKDWQAKEDYDLCLECYNEKQIKKNKSAHETLKEMAIEEEGQQEIKDKKKRKEFEKIEEEEDLADQRLGDSGHLENDLQGEED